MRVKKVVEGVKAVTDGFVLDFSVDTKDDIIDIASTHIEKSNIGPNIYYFGYKFNDNVPSSIRNKFISWLKMLKPNKNSISSSDLYRFIEKPLAELDSACPLITFDAIVYPESGRSPLVTDIMKVVLNYMNNDAIKIPTGLVKKLPQNVFFDMGAIKTICGDDINRYNQISKYLNDIVLPKIRKSEYFSIAHEVPTKYRRYVRNFLKLPNNELNVAHIMNSNKILIIDDINTSGATLFEMLRIIRTINHSAEIYVFTLVGKYLEI